MFQQNTTKAFNYQQKKPFLLKKKLMSLGMHLGHSVVEQNNLPNV